MTAANTMLTGTWRFVVYDAADIPLSVLLEVSTGRFGGAVNNPQDDPSIQPTLQMFDFQVNQDEKLVIEFKPDDDFTEADDSPPTGHDYVKIPVRLRNLRSKMTFPKEFVYADLTDEMPALDAQVWPAGRWQRVYSYTVKAQQALKIGQETANQDLRVASKYYLQKDIQTTKA